MKNNLFKFSFFIAIIFFVYIFSTQTIEGQQPVNDVLRGWLWSSSIGWVSLNCKDMNVCNSSNYKVHIASSTGDLSGYVWSSNVGWIRFNPKGPYPENPQYSAKIDFSSNIFSGWIRAVSYGDEWDGWMKITDAKAVNNKIVDNSESGGGWMWGSDVVGWLNFLNAYIEKESGSIQDFDLEKGFSVSCSSDKKEPRINEEVVWTAYPVRGIAPYKYKWFGSDGFFGDAQSVRKIYSTAGGKSAEIDVIDSKGNNAKASCDLIVFVAKYKEVIPR